MKIRLDGTVTIEGQDVPELKITYRFDQLDTEDLSEAMLRQAEKFCREIHAKKVETRIV